MSQKFSNSLILDIKASTTLGLLLGLIHLGAMLLVLPLPIPGWLKLGLWVALGTSLAYGLRTQALRRAGVIEAVELDENGDSAFRLRGEDRWRPGRISARFIHPWVFIGQVKLEGRRRSQALVVAADAVAPQAFRRWRARLRFRNAAE